VVDVEVEEVNEEIVVIFLGPPLIFVYRCNSARSVNALGHQFLRMVQAKELLKEYLIFPTI